MPPRDVAGEHQHAQGGGSSAAPYAFQRRIKQAQQDALLVVRVINDQPDVRALVCVQPALPFHDPIFR